VAEYTKDTRFSMGWVVGGAAIIFVLQFFAGIASAALQLGLWGVVAAGFISYVLGGFVIGWKSEGRTILEAGLAAVLVIAIVITIKGWSTIFDLRDMAIVYGVPFLSSMLGGWLGELLQGNVIRTSDD
jgi:hypothetical protein